MKRIAFLLITLTFVIQGIASDQRIKQSLDFDWKFILDDNQAYS